MIVAGSLRNGASSSSAAALLFALAAELLGQGRQQGRLPNQGRRDGAETWIPGVVSHAQASPPHERKAMHEPRRHDGLPALGFWYADQSSKLLTRWGWRQKSLSGPLPRGNNADPMCARHLL